MGPRNAKAREETVDEAIARIARRSHGVVSRSELLAAGLTKKKIRRRIERGSLVPIHRGVYGVGHRPLSREAVYVAAVKACGHRAVLGGRAAAHLWELIKGPPPQPEVLVAAKRQIPGVATRRVQRIDPQHISERRGIPLINVPRTLVDLASSLPESALARACHEAGVKYRTTPAQVERVLARLPNARGRAKLRQVLSGEVRVTLSRLEARFLKLLRDARLPLPVTNKAAGTLRVDCRWPQRRLTVELDSYRFHNSRHAWDKDRRREREARARGDRFRRYTSTDVFDDPAFMLAELRELLGVAELGPT